MKRVKAGTRIMKGQIDLNTYNSNQNRLHLFDGKFTTGYRVKDFRICPQVPTNVEEVMALISTMPKTGVPSSFNFADNENVAYYLWNAPNQTEHSEWKLILPDNMAVEDLWISCYTTGDETKLNYYVELEKFTFPAWDGAGILVEGISQGPSTS